MVNPFQKATKEKSYLRMALTGISGSGKTYTALNIAKHLVPDGKYALIDTEHGSASKYADQFDFDVVELENFEPKSYVKMIQAAAANGYDVLIVDSLSHAWNALLEMKDRVAARDRSENSFTAWRQINPHHQALIEALLTTPLHIIGTMRAKSDYIMEEYQDSKGNTKTKPVKVGLAPIQRDGMEYEFDVVCQMDIDNRLIVEKTRCPQLSGAVIDKPGKEIADILVTWLSNGVEPKPQPAPEVKPDQAGIGQESDTPARKSAPRKSKRAAQEAPKVDAGAGDMKLRAQLRDSIKLFDPGTWVDLISHFVTAGLAADEFEANGRLRHALGIKKGDAPWREVEAKAKELTPTVGMLAAVFEARANGDKNVTVETITATASA